MTFKKFLTDTVRYSNIFTVPTIPQLNSIEMVTFISIIFTSRWTLSWQHIWKILAQIWYVALQGLFNDQLGILILI